MIYKAFSIWYHHPIQNTGYYLWRRLPRAASSERRCRDEQKRTPRNIDTQHEGMELHRGCPGNVDAEIAFRVILFSITRKRILLSTSISHVEALMVLPSTSHPLVLVLPVARILTHSACDLRLFEHYHEEHPLDFNRFEHERTEGYALGE